MLPVKADYFVGRIVGLLKIFAEEATNLYRVAQLPGWNNTTAHRYIHYCLDQGFLEFDYEENDKGLVAKFYRITEKGKAFLASAPSALPPIEKKPRKEEKSAGKKGTGIYIKTA